MSRTAGETMFSEAIIPNPRRYNSPLDLTASRTVEAILPVFGRGAPSAWCLGHAQGELRSVFEPSSAAWKCTQARSLRMVFRGMNRF